MSGRVPWVSPGAFGAYPRAFRSHPGADGLYSAGFGLYPGGFVASLAFGCHPGASGQSRQGCTVRKCDDRQRKKRRGKKQTLCFTPAPQKPRCENVGLERGCCPGKRVEEHRDWREGGGGANLEGWPSWPGALVLCRQCGALAGVSHTIFRPRTK